MDIWAMKSAYTVSQNATVGKLLREGFEPFWGYRCTRNGKEDVKMYFRKAPEPVVTELEMLESEPPVVQIDPISLQSLSNIINQFAGLLNDAITDMIAEINKTRIQQLPMRAGGKLDVKYDDEESSQAVEEFVEGNFDPEQAQEQLLDELEDRPSPKPPRGDEIRVVDEVPDLPRRGITVGQEEAIDKLRKTSDVNITVYPMDDAGDVRVFRGGSIITIHRDGSMTEEENPAKANSLAEGV